MAACKTMREVLETILKTGNSEAVWERMVPFEEFWEIVGMKEIRELEKRYGV